MQRRRFASLACALSSLVLALSANALLAQQQTGELVIRVDDQTAGSLPGATVTLTSPALIRPLEGLTDSQGMFRTQMVLPPGTYAVAVSMPGFATAVQEGVIVNVGRTYTINIALGLATVQETLTVTAVSPVVDTLKSESAGIFQGEELEKAPGARDYTQFAAYMPSVNIDFMSGSDTSRGCADCGQASNGATTTGRFGISVDGSSGAENVFYVDGIDTTSIYTGMSNQGVRTEFVQEFQIKTAGYEAQYGGAMGGVMSVVTRSGGNQFRGNAFYNFSGSALTGQPRQRLRLDPESAVDIAEYTQDPEDSISRNELGFTVGGPIAPNRVWFFAGVAPQYTSFKRNVDFVSGESASFDQNDRFINFIGKADWQPHQDVRINGSFATDPYRQKGTRPSYDGTDNPDFAWSNTGFQYPSRTYAVGANIIPNPDFLVDVRFGVNHINTEQLLEPPGVRHLFDFSNGLVGFSPSDPLYRPRGFAEFGFSDGNFIARDLQNKNTLALNASYFLEAGGQHSLKFGYQFNRLSQDVNSGYSFDYIRYKWGQNYTAVDGRTLSSSCVGPDGVTYNPCGYYEARHPFGEVADIHTDRHALFIQDGWTIRNRMTINAGLRLEKEEIPSFSDLPEFQGAAFQWGFGDKIAPRLGASFDVLGDGRVKAFGSWGWFYDAMKLEMANGSFGGFKWESSYYLIGDANLDWTQQGGLQSQGPFPGEYVETRNWRIPSFEDLDPDLNPMRMTEAVAGIEWELQGDTALSFRYVHKNLDDAIEDVGRQTPAGEAYYITNPGRGFAVSKFLEAGLPPTPDPKRVYNAFESRITRRFRANFSFDVSYTYSRLRGLYSGLGSSDENGRLSPNVDRDFDLWFLNYDANGNLIDGPLNTDRPHQMKALFNYELDMGLRLGAFFRAMSGTPISRTANMENVDVLVENRGSDGRNPTWTQTDLFVVQAFSPFADPGKRIEVSFNVVNLFNQNAAVRTFRDLNRETVGLWVPGDPTSIILNGYDYKALVAAEGVEIDPRFLKADRFQAPIEARFGIKFVF